MTTQRLYDIAVLPGDGIGLEVTRHATCLALFGGSCEEVWVSIRISPLFLGIVYLLSRARDDAAAGLEEASAMRFILEQI